eukprot:gene1144-4363_t
MDTAQEVGLFGCTEWLTIPLNEDSAKNIFSFRDLSQRNQVNPSQAQEHQELPKLYKGVSGNKFELAAFERRWCTVGNDASENGYDIDDPFIDDSTDNVLTGEFSTRYKGFYICEGEVELTDHSLHNSDQDDDQSDFNQAESKLSKRTNKSSSSVDFKKIKKKSKQISTENTSSSTKKIKDKALHKPKALHRSKATATSQTSRTDSALISSSSKFSHPDMIKKKKKKKRPVTESQNQNKSVNSQVTTLTQSSVSFMNLIPNKPDIDEPSSGQANRKGMDCVSDNSAPASSIPDTEKQLDLSLGSSISSKG